MKKTTGKNRAKTDKFYTNSNVVDLCFDILNKYQSILVKCKLIEPSAGSGAFLHKLSNYDFDAFDIEPAPSSYKITKQDFLELDLTNYNKSLAFIGNPPFGRQSSIAKKFIKKISNYEKTNLIAFILPKSFKKESMQKCFNLYFSLDVEIDLPDNSFTINNKIHNVPCIFQIWKRCDKERFVTPTQDPKSFIYVKKNNNPDFSLRRVGVYAGKLSEEVDNKSEQSHYFIKLNESIKKNTFIEKYKTIHFEHNNTVGPKSISKKEFTQKINTII
jgi:hypothetical protein